MIDIQNLTKRFGQFTAVDHLSFQVNPGEVLGFLGPNGAGKSTTMRMIAGFLKPDQGRVVICGKDIQQQTLEAKRLLGYLPEGAPSYGDMRVSSFLNFIAQARGVDKHTRSKQVGHVIERLQLESVRQRPVDTLSKGFQRRVGIAQALVHDPKVLLLDEPTDGLDPNQKYQMRELIRELSSDKIVMISTHILEEVEAICQRAVIIHHGKLVADATPSELKTSSRYFQAVELDVDMSDELIETMKRIPGVKSVSLEQQHGQLVVTPEPGVRILEPVQTFLHDNAVVVRSMSVSAGRLDDVFRRVTQEECL